MLLCPKDTGATDLLHCLNGVDHSAALHQYRSHIFLSLTILSSVTALFNCILECSELQLYRDETEVLVNDPKGQKEKHIEKIPKIG